MRIIRIAGPALCGGMLGVALMFSGTGHATTLDDKKGQLGDLRLRIESLRGELAKAEETRNEAADQLREGEVAISVAARRLNELTDSRAELAEELVSLDRQIRGLDQSTAVEQAQLARLLNRQFVGGDSDALRLLLAGKDPNQAARDRYLLTRLSVAKAALTKELQGVAEQKRALRSKVKAREDKIRDIETARKEEHARLLGEQQRRAGLLESIAGKIRNQRKEIGALQRDEQRMTRLLDGLARIARRTGVTTRKPASGQQVDAGSTAPGGARRPARQRSPALADNDPGNVTGSFGKRRGLLGVPVAGRIVGRYGGRRDAGAESNGTWKGLFFKAMEGAEVRTVAPGTVVFSDWLRGFGNLLIVDHGDDFHSIYAFNQSLLRQVGDVVRDGERIAAAGNSGGNSESGLYFELRYQGRAFDPMKWMRR